MSYNETSRPREADPASYARGDRIAGWPGKAGARTVSRPVRVAAALIVMLFLPIAPPALAKSDQPAQTTATSPGPLGEPAGPLAATNLSANLSSPDGRIRHRPANERVSLTPSSTKPYWACPEDVCEAIIDPPTARTSGRWKLPQMAQALSGSGEEGGLDPQDLRSAYDIPHGAKEEAESSTQTVAIIDGYGDPSAEKDLIEYRQRYELPECTKANGCFKQVNEEGKEEDYPPEREDWQLEQALDVDMVSASCPSCHIVLVETAASLGAAVNMAVSRFKPTEISNSYGGPEEGHSLEEPNNADYEHPGILITASGGDYGYDRELTGAESPNYPASLPDVISVGGTRLEKADNTRGWSEEVWSEGGSGCSWFAKPAWQTDTGCAGRTTNDVAAVGACETPVSVRLEASWANLCGTSVGAPLIAGIEAHASEYARSLPGADAFYSDPSAFFDITKGSDGRCEVEYLCRAEVGYDGPTGNGTPDGPLALTSLSPIVAANAATAITEDSATLNGIVDPQGSATTYWFEYGTSVSYGQTVPINGESVGSADAKTSVSATVGLQPNTTYHYRLVAENANKAITDGRDIVLRTASPTVTDMAPAVGPANGGTSVTITGTNFAGVDAVNFGSVKARSFVVTSETSLTAVAPAELGGTVDVTVTTPAGTTPTSSADQFTYERVPWTVQSPSNEAGWREGWLNGASCVSGGSCMAVGHYYRSSGSENNSALAYQHTDGRWVQGAVTVGAGYRGPYLSGVSCTAANACTAVGGVEATASAAYAPLIVRWNGASWARQEVMLPEGAREGELHSVSCVSESECVAAGTLRNSAGTWVNYSAVWSRGTWTSLPTPTASEASHSEVTGVSCGSKTSCMAVGWYSSGSGAKPFSLAVTGGLSAGWSLQSRGSYGWLEAVSCASAEFCIAAGGDYGTPTIEAWNGAKWKPAKAPSLPDISGGSLQGTSCVSSTDCEVVGYGYGEEGEELVTLAATWNGASWTEDETPRAGEAERQLKSVSCVNLGECEAVGTSRPAGTWEPLIETREEAQPTAETKPAAAITETSATLNATVNPNGREVTECKFEYGASPSYGSSVPCSSLPGAGANPEPVSASVTGLSADTTYYFRIVATNPGGPSYGGEQRFKTAAPELPEVGTCVKLAGKNASGKYKTATCTIKSAPENTGKYEWQPWPVAKTRFTGEGGAAKLETVDKTIVKCLKETVAGEYTGSQTTTAVITFTGCEATRNVGGKCQSQGAQPAEIKTSALEGTLGVIKAAAKPSIGWDLNPVAQRDLAKFKCNGSTVSVLGSVIAPVTSVDKMTTTLKVVFKAEEGKQENEKFESGLKDTLSLLIQGSFSAEQQAGLTMSNSIVNEEKVEIKAIV